MGQAAHPSQTGAEAASAAAAFPPQEVAKALSCKPDRNPNHGLYRKLDCIVSTRWRDWAVDMMTAFRLTTEDGNDNA